MADRSSRKATLLLVALTLVVGWSRTIGLNQLLPQQHEPDHYAVYQAQFLQAVAAGEVKDLVEYFGEGGVRFFYYYPLHIARLWLLGGRPAPAAGALGEDTLDVHLRAASEPLLRGRRWSAWLSALIVPGVYLLARRFLGPWPSLLAAALAGTSMLHLVAAGQAKPHAIAASAAAFGLWGTTTMRRHPTPAGLALGGLCLALGVCALHNGGVLLAAGVTAFFLRDRAAQRGSVLAWAIPVASLVAVYAWLSPGVLIPPPEDSQQSYEGLRIEDGALVGMGHSISLGLFAFSRPWDPFAWLWWNDPAHLVAAGLGLMALLAGMRGADAARRRDAWVLAAHALPYTLVLASYSKAFDRYALPLLPHLCVLGSAGVAWVVEAAARRRPSARARLAAASAALVLALPVAGQVALLRLRTRPDTLEEAARWVRAQVPPGGEAPLVAVGPGVVLPLAYHPSDLGAAFEAWRSNPWLAYQAGLDADRAAVDGWRFETLPQFGTAARELAEPERTLAWVRGLGVRYLILEESQRTRALRPAFENLYDAVGKEGRLVERFLPRPDPQLPFLDFGDNPRMLARTLTQERLGPPIEVWRID